MTRRALVLAGGGARGAYEAGVLRFLALVGSSDEGDALSYLLFEPSFTTEMLDLGWADARRRQEELAAFFTD